jgi:hypothetical protein
MDQERLFAILGKQKKAILFDLLQDAYETMNTEQRRHVFGEFAEQEWQSENINGCELLDRIQHFHRDSLNGVYYAPFDINSKNFMHIPEETEEWFNILGDCLKRSAKLTEQEDHARAVECFALLYELIDTMERGEEIVFADECGSWMIPGDEKTFVQAYVTSLAAVETPEGFTVAAFPLIQRDSYQSFATRAYTSAMRAANKQQSAALKAELKRQNIRTSTRS